MIRKADYGRKSPEDTSLWGDFGGHWEQWPEGEMVKIIQYHRKSTVICISIFPLNIYFLILLSI